MSGHTGTNLSRVGKKWVGLNYEEKENAKVANDGKIPYTLSLVTSDFPHKAEWSETNLPDILFYIQPPTSQYEGVKVEDLIEDGQPVVSDAPDGHHIRYFEILPRYISLDVPGWLVEAWRRLDTRIGYQDILDRQCADPKLGLKKHSKNALQNHCRRECRKVLNTWVEYGRRDEPHRTDVEAIEVLSHENIRLNTILKPSLLFPSRLVKVRLQRKVEDGLYYATPHEVTLENWKETTLPLDYFLPDSQPREMTPKMHAAWEMYLILTERATVHGHEHWSKLPRSCLPVTWFDRTTTKSVPNDTYDGGCAICTWSLDRPIPANPDVKPETKKSSSATKAKKRRRSRSRAEVWDLGDTPKAPKRRYVKRLSQKRTNGRASPSRSDVAFEETHRRRLDDRRDYNSIASNRQVHEYDEGDLADGFEDSPPNEDAGNKGSEEGKRNKDRRIGVTHAPLRKTEPLPRNNEEITGMVSNARVDDPFRQKSVMGIDRRPSDRQVEIATGSLSSPVQYPSREGAWPRCPSLLRSDSLPQNFDHSPRCSIDETTLLHSDLGQFSGYLPARAFPNYYSTNAAIAAEETIASIQPREPFFQSVMVPLESSFSSNDASISTAASAFTEACLTDIGYYSALPTPATVGLPTAQFYPLPMMHAQTAFGNFPYPSPPQTATYRSQMSFNSSPPRRPEEAWEWTQNRPRRHSETDAVLGFPNDFAELGAFGHNTNTISGYLHDQEFAESLGYPPATSGDEFNHSHALEDGEHDSKKASAEKIYGEGAAIGWRRGDSSDNEFWKTQTNHMVAPLSFL